MGLVTLEAAKRHLKPPGTVDDTRITDIIAQATSIVLEYIKKPEGEYQNAEGAPIAQLVPPNVQAACLLVIGSLYDNADGQNKDKDPLSPAVKSLLHARRMPSIA